MTKLAALLSGSVFVLLVKMCSSSSNSENSGSDMFPHLSVARNPQAIGRIHVPLDVVRSVPSLTRSSVNVLVPPAQSSKTRGHLIQVLRLRIATGRQQGGAAAGGINEHSEGQASSKARQEKVSAGRQQRISVNGTHNGSGRECANTQHTARSNGQVSKCKATPRLQCRVA